MSDVALLLDLCNELDTTADVLLDGGNIVNKKRKRISVVNIVTGFEHIAKLKDCFGEESTFYRGMIDGISNNMNFDFEATLAKNPEVLYTEVIIQYLHNGYKVDLEEAKQWITNEKYLNEIRKRMN